MKMSLGVIALLCAVIALLTNEVNGGALYDVYTAGGIINPAGPGLLAEGPSFTLNGKDFHILSGAIHYFRVPPQYWRDRIQKLKAIGANTLETYMPWNLHEEFPGQFDFSGHLDIRQFLQIAQEEDLFVILRPGPYICSEWEFGGVPSWLLRNPNIKLRTSESNYTSAVQSYYNQLIPLVTDLQFSKGGPIIMVQVENEYGSFEVNDPDYLNFLRDLMTNLGIVELFANSDSCGSDECRRLGTIPGLLMTANFQDNPEGNLDQLARLQPDRPLMVMEYWTGWFDFWGQKHHVLDVDTYVSYVQTILSRNASLSMYMFHGGTSFGFMNGADADLVGLAYLPIVNSYDYDAPLSESGDYTPKYNATKKLFADFSKGRLWDVPLPDPPAEMPKYAYGTLPVTKFLNFEDILSLAPSQKSDVILPMEQLSLYGSSGQNFGYIVYRTNIYVSSSGSVVQINGLVRTYAKVLVDDVEVASYVWGIHNHQVEIPSTQSGERVLTILVENGARVNFGNPLIFNPEQQARGLNDSVLLDNVALANWTIYSLDFSPSFFQKLSTTPWRVYTSPSNVTYPSLFSVTLDITQDPQDTFLSSTGWSKGIFALNNFVLGRYWDIGPQMTLYVPAPFLNQGSNEILAFELQAGSSSVSFQSTPDLGPTLQGGKEGFDIETIAHEVEQNVLDVSTVLDDFITKISSTLQSLGNLFQ